VVGCGTWRTFDVGRRPEERAPLAEVLDVLFEAGGSVIDSSPMYGAAEGVVGDLLAAAGTRDKAFLATKVWTSGRDAGIAQMTRVAALLKTDHVELMQIHNLVDWRATCRPCAPGRPTGRIRYSASRTTPQSARRARSGDARGEVRLRAAELRARRPRRRDAACCRSRRARHRGARQPAVRRRRLLRKLLPRKLPDWAGEIGCTSWAQMLLKFVLGQPAVTCVIPGTGKPEHMRDNVQAGLGVYPDAAMLKKMVADVGV
jgi:aryl-alcohol dehydrogenase-like predicted oxidoreductase